MDTEEHFLFSYCDPKCGKNEKCVGESTCGLSGHLMNGINIASGIASGGVVGSITGGGCPKSYSCVKKK